MEKAKRISSKTALASAGADRIYFGSEFCERLLPSVTELKRILKEARRLEIKFSLLTPPSTEIGVKHIRVLVACLNEDDEIIVNDYGVLRMIDGTSRNPVVIGRVLGRNFLHALKALGRDDHAVNEHISLLGSRIKGIEVDYFNAGSVTSFLSERTGFFLYTGAVFWTTTRRCAFNQASKPLDKFAMCQRQCLVCEAILENKAAHKKFLLHGNAIFNMSDAAFSKPDYKIFKRIVSP